MIALQQTDVVNADTHLGPPVSWYAGADSTLAAGTKAQVMALFPGSFNVFTTAII
jgi:hypothetical protein